LLKLFQGCDNGGDNLHEWKELKGIATTASLLCDTDEPSPTREKRDVTDNCSSRGKQLMTGLTLVHTTYEGALAPTQQEKD
jgi:hypothetical protein